MVKSLRCDAISALLTKALSVMPWFHVQRAAILHAITSGFPTWWKIFMGRKCCSRRRSLVESRDVVLVLTTL